MKAYMWSRGYSSPHSQARWRWAVNFMCWLLQSWKWTLVSNE